MQHYKLYHCNKTFLHTLLATVGGKSCRRCLFYFIGMTPHEENPQKETWYVAVGRPMISCRNPEGLLIRGITHYVAIDAHTQDEAISKYYEMEKEAKKALK